MGLLLLLLCLCASAAGQLVSVDGGRGMEGEPSGAIVGVVSWIIMVAVDSVVSPQK